MNFKNFFKKIGENSNTPTIAMCLIAIFKGVFRPLFTMMDKKSDPETKKYAAAREFLTEVAALPLYALTPLLAAKLADKVAKNIKGADIGKIKATAKFIGLGVATLLIPMVCNIIQPPLMNAYKKSQEAKKNTITNPVKANTTTPMPVKPTFNGRINYGMKVGG